ncbi:hypothetical protein SUGI_0645330 [Cryptomeria japonica]|nr:hypothetical protein SUGI_0645330 [Cryptomeria japonica]
MVYGRERSPSPLGEGKAERHRPKSPYLAEREELLGFNENIPINLPNALAGINPRVPSSPLMSPKKPSEVGEVPPPKQTKQRLRSPGYQSHAGLTEVVPTRVMLRRSPRKEPDDLPLQEELPLVPIKRSSNSKGKDKSPHSSRRAKSDMISTEEEQLELDLRQKKTRGEDPELQVKSLCQLERQPSRTGRPSRRTRMELQEIAEGSDNVGVETNGKSTRRGRTQTRHQKRKVPDPALPTAAPEALTVNKSNTQGPQLSRSSSQPRKSRRVPEVEITQERTKWLQYMADLIMWKETPKSAFIFGSGSFCVISSFFTDDLPVSFVTIVSYLVLFYLALIFLYKSFIHRESVDHDTSSTNYEISEADALCVIRVILPPVNALFAKIRELFSGDPSTTLKLASVLWLLAECGHMMTMWTLIRLGFFVIFIIPKFYSSYSAQVHGYGDCLLLHCWEAWNTCTHKKAVLASVAALAWNLSSVTSRVLGAFILTVALRLYQKSLNSELDSQNEFLPPEDVQDGETNAIDISGLELMAMSQKGS